MKPSHLALTRRRFLARATQAAAAAALTAPWITRGASAPKVTLLESKVISHQPEYYHGWSTVARRKNGELWLTWSGGRESHVCPFGQVQAMTSRDDGATWSWPRVLLDSDTDDRDSGVLETKKGSLVVTTFTSLAYEDHFTKGTAFGQHTEKGWQSRPMPPEQKAKWTAARARLTDEERTAELGVWAIRSTDGGRSWSNRIPTVVNSPHGPIQLKDGRLLYAGKQLWTKDRKVGVSESRDDGLTWQWLADIPTRTGDKSGSYHELHAVEAANGTLIAQIRNHNESSQRLTLQSESRDQGRTWSEPRPICYGFPTHLLRLRDDRLLMTYGFRRVPYGNRARISADHGKTWGEEIVLSDHGKDGDLGYPSTVELADATLLTVWYQSMVPPAHAALHQVKWRLG